MKRCIALVWTIAGAIAFALIAGCAATTGSPGRIQSPHYQPTHPGGIDR